VLQTGKHCLGLGSLKVIYLFQYYAHNIDVTVIKILQITACEDVSEVRLGRFWELVPGRAVGSLSIRVRPLAPCYAVVVVYSRCTLSYSRCTNDGSRWLFCIGEEVC
jgi:hypothetical protein